MDSTEWVVDQIQTMEGVREMIARAIWLAHKEWDPQTRDAWNSAASIISNHSRTKVQGLLTTGLRNSNQSVHHKVFWASEISDFMAEVSWPLVGQKLLPYDAYMAVCELIEGQDA